MASTKVGDGLSYQAALRWVMGCRFCNAWAARVVQEKSPSRAGVVRDGEIGPLALCLQMGSYLVEGTSSSQYKPFQDLGRVRRLKQGLSGEPWGESAPTNEDGRCRSGTRPPSGR